MTLSEVQASNYWDAFTLDDNLQAYGERIFGNRGVGNIFQTNMMVPGQFPSNRTVIVQHWYARTNIASFEDWVQAPFALWSHDVILRFVVNERPRWTLPLSDLLRMWKGPSDDPEDPAPHVVMAPWPLVIMPRSSVGIDVQSRVRWQSMVSRRTDPNVPMDQIRVWIHLGGLEFTNETDRDPQRTKDLHEVLARITHAERKSRTAVDQIADWILGMSDSATEAAETGAAVQLAAVADGVLEGRWMGTPPRPRQEPLLRKHRHYEIGRSEDGTPAWRDAAEDREMPQVRLENTQDMIALHEPPDEPDPSGDEGEAPDESFFRYHLPPEDHGDDP